MGSFFHAVRVFGDQLAAVRWQFLAIALGIHLRPARAAGRGPGGRSSRRRIPGERIRFRSVFGAYVAGVGVNSIVPARAGDVVKLYLIKHRIEGSSYATLDADARRRDALRRVRRRRRSSSGRSSIGVLPTHQVYSRLPSVDWGFFVKHATWTEIGLALLVGGARDRR